MRGGKRDEGVGTSSSIGLARHPGSERHQQNLDSELAAIYNSTFPERKKRDITTVRLRPNIRRTQFLSTHFLLLIPPSRTHSVNTRSWRTNKIIANPHPSLNRRSYEWPTAENEDTNNCDNGTVFSIKVRSKQAAGIEVPSSHNNTRAMSFNQELFQAFRWLTGWRQSNMPPYGDLDVSRWPLWAAI